LIWWGENNMKNRRDILVREIDQAAIEAAESNTKIVLSYVGKYVDLKTNRAYAEVSARFYGIEQSMVKFLKERDELLPLSYEFDELVAAFPSLAVRASAAGSDGALRGVREDLEKLQAEMKTCRARMNEASKKHWSHPNEERFQCSPLWPHEDFGRHKKPYARGARFSYIINVSLSNNIYIRCLLEFSSKCFDLASSEFNYTSRSSIECVVSTDANVLAGRWRMII
jgi:hypothetical protein